MSQGQTSSSLANNTNLMLDKSHFKLTLNENFDSLSLYKNGGIWQTEWYYGGAGTLSSHTFANQQSVYMDPTWAGTGTKPLGINPFSIHNGELTITAAPTPASVLPYVGGHTYTSGVLTTYKSFSQEYGYFEMRAKLPAGQGMYSAFWMLPSNGSWPPELDIFEALGRDPTKVYETALTSVNANGVRLMTQHISTIDFTQYHVYGVNWGPQKIDYYIDNVLVAEQNTPETMHKEMYLIAELGVGGTWIGNSNASTGTRTMTIDYIHAYQTQDTVSTTIGGVHTVYNTFTPIPGYDVHSSTAGNATFQGGAGHDEFVIGAGALAKSSGLTNGIAADAVIFGFAGAGGAAPASDDMIAFTGFGAGSTLTFDHYGKLNGTTDHTIQFYTVHDTGTNQDYTIFVRSLDGHQLATSDFQFF